MSDTPHGTAGEAPSPPAGHTYVGDSSGRGGFAAPPAPVNHFCTYFDRNFLVQGMALADSVRRNDPSSVLWVLCLDDFSRDYLAELGEPRIRPVALAELEAHDPELRSAKSRRTRVEYYFTLSPCWPRHLLRTVPGLNRITYLDADMYWFASPCEALEEIGDGSVLITEHRHPDFLRHHRRFGRFNVGLLSFRNDAVGIACLEWWRNRCLEWCEDRVDGNRYADQRYLDQWPARYGAAVRISRRAGVNLAPWNWAGHHYHCAAHRVFVDGQPLELFHFARFRPERGTWLFQSGQLEYGVMPWTLRQRIYGRYWEALRDARARIRRLRPGFDFPARSSRGWHQFWRAFLPRAVFGSDWLRVGSVFISGRFGLGQHSGRVLSTLRGLRRPKADAERETAEQPMPQPNALPESRS
ncbi:hypothetical protein DB347_21340 [Opitutaceae bacterium EW11]|nr:hypothetical protein DB347_21340 [Opitutaceae bacterium EW11]